MKGEIIRIGKKEIEGFVIPIGKVNLVFARTDKGLVGCGAFDVMALEKFGYAAAKVKPKGEAFKTHQAGLSMVGLICRYELDR